ncbi:MAG: choice-of-anchor B family protein, partial [Proteobacteria bacterium]|nr:choice-of-anchor B family protein [Pseudomonadota bacterium]
MSKSSAATPCTNGSAAGFACANIDLLAHVRLADISSKPNSGADIWGFVDLNSNREYAIIGVSNGTAVFDITNPELPFEIGLIPGQTTPWRDIKVFQFYDAAASRWKAYAYVTTDGNLITDGLFVIDLTGLPHSIQRIDYASDFNSAHNVFATNTDYSTGLSLTGDTPQLIVAGSDVGIGQFRLYSLANPESPAFVSTAVTAGNMHDATTFFVTDQRKDTQCVNAMNVDACEILIDFRGQSIDVWDITDPTDLVRLSVSTYPNQRFSHSGWQSEDGLFLFVHDELDERDFGLNTTVNVLSLADLTSLVHLGSWVGPTTAIDHNGFVRGNRYYMSNYTRGLTILDITNPVMPATAGFFDTYAADDVTGFNGAWGVYPYFHSGTIAISDIDSGLYLLKGRTRNVAQGQLVFSASSFAAEEGQQASLLVQRLGGSTGAISVNYQIVPATASSADFQTVAGTLAWVDGDSTDKSIAINLTDDGIAEGLEHVIVRLTGPTGGATLGDQNTASLYISDTAAGSGIGFLDTTIDSSEIGLATVILIVQRSGSALGQASVDYAVNGGDASVGIDFSGDTDGT